MGVAEVSVDAAQQHQLAAIRMPEKVRPNDKLFKMVKAE